MSAAFESFPEALLSHLQPCLFVAGLNDNDHAVVFKEEFQPLLTNLRQVLSARARLSVWDTSKGSSADFHIVMVPKSVRFPPRKAKAPADSASITLHSPISPLTPSSPLYPDGIIAPIWIRKHREMLPCTFVLALTLWEPDFAETGPLTGSASEQYTEAERKMDAELVGEILDRKKQTTERGIKLAVILFASQQMLDHPVLDYRLSLIRRQSGLDSRASLFVISPVALNEVQNFVASLQRELYDSAIDYYKDHGRRVRRKKGRVPTAVGRPIGGAAGVPSSSPQAWSCRYDYKLGAFAEFRQEFEVALKHYEDCYSGLIDMFGAESLLPPRTKRWLEAKVLADCTNAKIFKLYLYLDDTSRAAAQINRHLNRFRALCDRWGIGDSTFEFWSWTSKQYRLIAELLELAIRGGFTLPAPSVSLKEQNPFCILQHPAHFYYLAALAAIERKAKFQDVAPPDTQALENESAAMKHERTVDHVEQIIDLLTKAYEAFKRLRANRTSLAAVSLIAASQLQAQNHSTALKFYDRISKSYRPECWTTLLVPVLQQGLACARQIQDAPAILATTLELRSNGVDEVDVEGALEGLQSAPLPQEGDPRLDIDMTKAKYPLVSGKASFYAAEATLDQPVQLKLVISLTDQFPTLDFVRAIVHFSEETTIQLTHDATATTDFGTIRLASTTADQTNPVNLGLQPGKSITIGGNILLSQPASLRLQKLTLLTQAGQWLLAFHVGLEGGVLSCSFAPRPLRVSHSIAHKPVALLDEHFLILLTINNEDDVAVDATLHLSVPQVAEGATTVSIDGPSSLILQPTSLGRIEAGSTLERQLYLNATGSVVRRTADMVIRCVPVLSPGNASAALPAQIDLRQSFAVSVVQPIQCLFHPRVRARRKADDDAPALSLQPLSGWEDAQELELLAQLDVRSDDNLTITDISLSLNASSLFHGYRARLTRAQEDDRYLRLVDSSVSAKDFPLTWSAGDGFSVSWLLDLLPAESVSQAFLQIQWSRADSALSSTAFLPLPFIPSLEETFENFALVAYPQTTRLHQPTLFRYAIRNAHATTPLRLSLTVESSPDWVLSSPRKVSELTVLPGLTRTVAISGTPVGQLGTLDIPRLRVLQVLKSDALLDEASEGTVRTREWPVLPEGMVWGAEMKAYDEEGNVKRWARITVTP